MKSTPEAALRQRLATLSDVPTAWPNVSFNPADPGNLPYIACTIVRAGTSDQTLDGQSPIVTGRLIATVVVEQNTGEVQADQIAERVADLFPMGLRIATDDIITVITQPAHIREGIPDGAYWRVPVSIPFQIVTAKDSTP